MTAHRLNPEVGQVESAESVFYPIEDDEPLAESEHQLFPLVYAYQALTTWFSDDPTPGWDRICSFTTWKATPPKSSR